MLPLLVNVVLSSVVMSYIPNSAARPLKINAKNMPVNRQQHGEQKDQQHARRR